VTIGASLIAVILKMSNLITLGPVEFPCLIAGVFFFDLFTMIKYSMNEDSDFKGNVFKIEEVWNDDCETIYNKIGIYRYLDKITFSDVAILFNLLLIIIALVPGAYDFIYHMSDPLLIITPIVAIVFYITCIAPKFKRKRIFDTTFKEALKEYDYKRINPTKEIKDKMIDYMHKNGGSLFSSFYFDGYKVTDDFEIYGVYNVGRYGTYRECDWIGLFNDTIFLKKGYINRRRKKQSSYLPYLYYN